MLQKLYSKIKKNPLLRYGTYLVIVLIIFVVAQKGFLGNRAEQTTTAVKNIASGGFELNQENAAIDLSTLKQGCPFKDCIPSIDEPKFIFASEADRQNSDHEIVFAIDYEGIVRAYPQKILNSHEIVNDTIAGKPVVISFCPLCGTAIAFEATVNGKPTEFGVSGKLVQSNLVMYDRQTETLWQHATGEAIAGELVGERLTQFPIETTTWGLWKEAHPDTQVLSQDTGSGRSYDSYPYGDYESSGRFLFPPDKTDDRLHPKAIGYGVEIGNEFKFYPEDKIKSIAIIDNFAGKKLKITRNTSGAVTISDSNTGENINFLRGMWFSWYAFNPDTELF